MVSLRRVTHPQHHEKVSVHARMHSTCRSTGQAQTPDTASFLAYRRHSYNNGFQPMVHDGLLGEF